MKKANKLIAVLLCLVMILSISPVNVFAATNPTTLTGHGSNVGSITVSGISVDDFKLTTSTNSAGTVYTYNIAIPAGTSGTATVKLTRANSSNTNMIITQMPPAAHEHQLGNSHQTDWNVSISNGVGSLSVFVYGNLGANRNYDTYVFNFAAGNPISISTGDPVYIAWNASTPTSGTVTPRDGGTTIPASFTLWVDGVSSIKVNDVTKSANYNNGTNYAFTINTSSTSPTNIVVEAGGKTYTIYCPTQTAATPGGTAPTSVVSYLPIGQFATGSEWGSVTGKFAGKTSLESTGVSLGALGGYVEFYYAGGIEDKATNPYGVDFVVYGNAFDGNPEAGAVQVSVDGVTWYELAGSKYYDSALAATNIAQSAGKFSAGYTGTLRNATVTYTKQSNGIKAVLTGGSTSLTADLFTAATSWWPSSSTYPMAGTHNNSGNVDVNFTSTSLQFTGITAVEDSDVTADYAFGYADVTPNGSPSNLGAPVNPYASNASGGDGFDLAWAVDSNGNPVNVGKVYYVRVYTAVLDNGYFGETSTEVCGIFTTYGSNGCAATEDLYIADAPDEDNEVETSNRGVTSVSAGNYILYSEADYVYVNGVRITDAADGYTFSVTSGSKIQIITQSGAESPYITVLNCN